MKRLTEEELLKKHGWEIECKSPFEIRTIDGSFASGQAANIVVEYLYDIEEKENSVFDDKIDEWHEDKNTILSLHEYLGLTKDQYLLWLNRPELIEKHYR